MKKILYLLVVAILLSACSKEEKMIGAIDQPNSQEQNKNIRTYDEALAIAQNSIKFLNGTSTTRSVSNDRKIDLNDKQVFMLDAKTRANSDINDTLIYVFNFENNDGFVLVSASKATEGLLAVTEKGHCNPDEKTGNEGFDLFVEMAKDYVANSKTISTRGAPLDSSMSVNVVTVSEIHKSVNPLLSVLWGQELPEGEFCPNFISGCCNTAMAQIMSYYEHPTSITLTYPNAPVSNLSLPWSAMRSHLTQHPFSILCANPTAHKAISRLVRELGHRTSSNYSLSTETTTTLDSVNLVIPTLGYSKENHSYSDTYIRDMLDYNKLLLITGNQTNYTYLPNSGHMWVIDGYSYHYILQYVYIREGNSPWILDEICESEQHMNHFNWGDYGNCNGYFFGGVFNTQNGYYDYPNNSLTNNYQYSVQLICMYHN